MKVAVYSKIYRSPRKCQSRSTNLPRHQKRDEEQIRITQTHIYSHRCTKKEELQQKNHFGTVSKKTAVGLGGGLKLVLFVGTSDAALVKRCCYNHSRGCPKEVFKNSE